MVIVLLAVLSAVAVPRLAGRSAFESRAFADEVASAVRYAQRTAIAMRRNVTVVVATPGRDNPCALRLCITADCSQQVVNPATSQAFCLVPPPSVALATDGATRTGLQFDASGRPSGAQTYTVSSTGAGVDARTLTVEAETGHVR
ncbi:MAG: GspH/FimT family protein [Burkholderiales bacterium]|nr:GspH/FimT family protein [Burkholderiales bacterium]